MSENCGLPLFKDGIYFSKFLGSYKRVFYEMTMLSLFRVPLTKLRQSQFSPKIFRERYFAHYFAIIHVMAIEQILANSKRRPRMIKVIKNGCLLRE